MVAADARAGTVEISYEAGPEFTNRIGTLAGGMLSGMLDSATGLAALVTLPEELVVVHTSLRVEYLHPARPGRLAARGRVLERGERDVRTAAELLDADGVVVARGEATLRVLRRRPA